MMFPILIFAAATSLVDPAPARLQEWTKASIDLLPSQIFVPRSHASDLRPVIVFLHGGGDGPYDVMNRQSLPSLLLNNHTFARHFPFIVLLPCSTCDSLSSTRGWSSANFDRLERLLELALRRFRGDPTRVYLTGQSMGGYGLWHYAGRPNIFAALVPVCASARPSQALLEAACCREGAASCCPPVWAFHGANDRVVPIAFTDKWVQGLRGQSQRKSEVRYTKYDDAPPPPMKEYSHLVGHGSYELAYREPELFEWLLTKRCETCRPRPARPATEL